MLSKKFLVLGLVTLLVGTNAMANSESISVKDNIPSCERLEKSKNLAAYIISDNLKYFNTYPGNKTIFSAVEIFEDAPIETSRDLLEQIERSYKLDKSVSKLNQESMFWAVTINDFKMNGLIPSHEKFDTPLCK